MPPAYMETFYICINQKLQDLLTAKLSNILSVFPLASLAEIFICLKDLNGGVQGKQTSRLQPGLMAICELALKWAWKHGHEPEFSFTLWYSAWLLTSLKCIGTTIMTLSMTSVLLLLLYKQPSVMAELIGLLMLTSEAWQKPVVVYFLYILSNPFNKEALSHLPAFLCVCVSSLFCFSTLSHTILSSPLRSSHFLARFLGFDQPQFHVLYLGALLSFLSAHHLPVLATLEFYLLCFLPLVGSVLLCNFISV